MDRWMTIGKEQFRAEKTRNGALPARAHLQAS